MCGRGQQALQNLRVVGGVCGCGVAVGCRPTLVASDAASPLAGGEETRFQVVCYRIHFTRSRGAGYARAVGRRYAKILIKENI